MPWFIVSMSNGRAGFRIDYEAASGAPSLTRELYRIQIEPSVALLGLKALARIWAHGDLK